MRLLVFLLLGPSAIFAASMLDPGSSQEEYTFRVQVQTVYVDVFVTRDGKPIAGLTKDSFEVTDNGVPQQVDLLDAESVPLSALLALDVSASVRGEQLRHLRAAAQAFVDGLSANDEVGLLTFTQKLHLRKSLDADVSQINRALKQVTSGGSTAFNDALFAGLKLLEAAKGRPLLLLFTDGMDNASQLQGSDLIDIARASEAIVYAVGVRSREGVTLSGRRPASSMSQEAGRFLERLTESTGGQVWFADSTADLKEAYLAILAEMETRYLLSYQPEGAQEEGWHEIKVKLKGRKAGSIRARSGYFRTPPVE